MVDRKTSMGAASVALDRIQQRLGTTIPKVPPRERVRHRKTGGTYVIVSREARLHSPGPLQSLRDMQTMSVFAIGTGPDRQFVVRRCAESHPKQEAFFCAAQLQVFDGVLPDDKFPFVLYKSDTDGSHWLRPVAEFDDGRFETIGAAAWETPPAQVPPATPALPTEPFFHVHIATWTTGEGTSYYVCIDRADRSADVLPWDMTGRAIPHRTTTLESAENEVKMWDEFLNGNRGATS